MLAENGLDKLGSPTSRALRELGGHEGERGRLFPNGPTHSSLDPVVVLYAAGGD